MNDPHSRPIVLSLVVLSGFVILALAAALIIPFDVDEAAAIQHITGDAELLWTSDQAPTRLDVNHTKTLTVGQGLNVLPNGEAHITFELTQGRVILTGPATLTLIESYRRATALDHLREAAGRDFVLTLEQTQGSARYFFAPTDPAFDKTRITIRLPDGSFTPTSPCWRIDITPSGESQITPFDCPMVH
jgi:hypothetical protein